MKPVSAELLQRLRELAQWHEDAGKQWAKMTENEFSKTAKDHRDKATDLRDVLQLLEGK